MVHNLFVKLDSKIPLQFNFKLFTKRLLLSLIALLSLPVLGQTIRVQSEQQHRKIFDAVLSLKSEKLNKDTLLFNDQSGVFDITNFDENWLPALVGVSGTGFKSKQVKLTEKKDLTVWVEMATSFTLFDEVAVTAQYENTRTENAVHKINVINREKIDALGAQNLRDVMTNEMNVRLSQDNVLGSSMSLQGVSGQNVKILIDGVPVTGRLNGNIDISQINMNNVERIEIIEGPLSVSYGTDALAGTINIITKKNVPQKLSMEAYTYYESMGQYNTNGKIGWNKKKHSFSLAGGRNYFDGWNSYHPPFFFDADPIADSTRFSTWKPKEQFYGTFNYRYRLSDWTVDFTSDYFFEEVENKGRPRAPYFQTAFDDFYLTNRWSNSVHAKGKLNDNFNFNGFVAYNHFQRKKNTYFRDLTNLDKQLTTSSGDQDTSVFNNVMSRATISSNYDSSWVNFELGYDVNHEIGFGPRIENERQVIGDYALFGTAEIKALDRMVIRPGLRAIHNTAYKAPLVPSLNVKYSFLNSDKRKKGLDMRLSYARGFRAPDLKELYFFFVDINHNIQGNPDLKAEQSHNFNGSLNYYTRKEKREYKVAFSAFYNNISQMISLAQSTATEYSYFNIDRFESTGVQINNDWVFGDLKFSFGASYIGRYNQLTQNETTGFDRFLFSPELRSNVMYKIPKLDLTLSLFYKYTGKMPIVMVDANQELLTSIISDFHTADFSASKVFWNKQLNATMGVKNIFDVTNIVGSTTGGAHSGGSGTRMVAMGRTYFFSLSYRFNQKIKN